MQRGRLHLFLIPIAALIPILPLILHGCSCGHDFDFHILSWFEAARQFAHGNLHPQWAITAAYDAGEPRFVFYPPISWTLGAILSLLMPPFLGQTWTPIAYTWIVLTAAGLSLHHLARHFATPTAALLASIFYIANPYMLFTAYERTAYAELLAAIWIPILLLAILRDRVTIPGIAIPVALLWLTNAPAAVMSCYALALLTIVRLATTPRITKPETTTSRTTASGSATKPGAPSSRRSLPLRWASHERATAPAHLQTRTKLAINTAAGTILGLALAAIYLVPAAYERRYIQIAEALTPGFRIQDNFLFHHTTTGLTDPTALSDALLHDQVLHTASTIALLLIILTTLITAAIRKPQPTTSLAILTAAITLLLTPISVPIWRHAPELHFLQFPWRLVAILAAALSLTLAIALTKIRLTPITITAIALTMAAALTYPAYTVFHQDCDPEDTVAARLALFHANLGSDASDEYTPITADNDALAHDNPPYWFASNANAPAPPNSQPGPAPTHFTFKATQPGFLILNLRDYPSWDVTSTDPNSMHLNHPNHISRPDGLIALPIYNPADYTIAAAYTTPRDQTIGGILTILALIILSILLLRDRTRA